MKELNKNLPEINFEAFCEVLSTAKNCLCEQCSSKIPADLYLTANEQEAKTISDVDALLFKATFSITQAIMCIEDLAKEVKKLEGIL